MDVSTGVGSGRRANPYIWPPSISNAVAVSILVTGFSYRNNAGDSHRYRLSDPHGDGSMGWAGRRFWYDDFEVKVGYDTTFASDVSSMRGDGRGAISPTVEVRLSTLLDSVLLIFTLSHFFCGSCRQQGVLGVGSAYSSA